MRTVVVVNPAVGHFSGPDEPLWYVEPYFEALAWRLRRSGVAVEYLGRDMATRERVWEALRGRPRAVAAAGHGDAATYTGYMAEPVLWVGMDREGYDYSWTAGSDMLVLSCFTAARLGPHMVERGARSYLGWAWEFAFPVRYGSRRAASWQESPERLFLEPVEVAFALAASGEWTPARALGYIGATYASSAGDPSLPHHYRALLIYDAAGARLAGGAFELTPDLALTAAVAFAAGLIAGLGLE